MFKRGLIAAAVLAILLLVLWPRLRSTFEPPTREGPLGLVAAGGKATLWLMTKQEEERSRRIGPTRSGRMVMESFYHFRLQAHDVQSAQRLWIKEFKVVKDDQGGHGAQARILGQQGDVVWAWMHDQVLALSAGDARVLADKAKLEQVNPDLRGLLPSELQFYTWVGDLVVELADGRKVRLRVPDYRAEAYEVADEAQFTNANFMSTTWNGGYRTEQFGVRSGLFGQRWIGLLSDKEKRDAEQDPWGDNYRNADEIDDEGKSARRSLWQATLGRTEEFSEGSHTRLAALTRLPGTGTYLQGRMLKAPTLPGTPTGKWTRSGKWEPTAGEPLQLSPPGVLVLHRTRVDALGRLALSRLDGGFAETWHAALPLENLGSRWPVDQHLLLFGDWNQGQPGMSDVREGLLSVDLRSGRWKGWDVGAEKAIASAP